jgi:hypothetical protein
MPGHVSMYTSVVEVVVVTVVVGDYYFLELM